VPDLAYPALLLVWALLLSAPLFKVVTDHDAFLAITHTGKASLVDFVKFYAIGKLCRSADRAKLYDAQVQNAYIKSVLDQRDLHADQLGQYTPQFCLAMAPLSLLPINLSYGLWMIATLTIFVGSLRALSDSVKVSDGRRCSLYFYALVLAAPAAIFNILLGQAGFLSAGLFALFWLAFLRGSPIATGIALASFVLKPQYLPFLAFTCLADRRDKTLWIAAGAALALTAGTVAVLGWQALLAYPRFLHDCEFGLTTVKGLEAQAMIGWRGLLSLWLPQSAIAWTIAPVTLLGACACYLAWRESAQGSRQSQAMSVLSITCIGLLTSAHTHIYDLLLLAAPLALLFPSPSWAGVFNRENGPARWLLALFLIYPLIAWAIYLQGPADWSGKNRWQGIYVLALLGISLAGLIQDRQKSTTTPGTNDQALRRPID